MGPLATNFQSQPLEILEGTEVGREYRGKSESASKARGKFPLNPGFKIKIMST